MTARVSTVIPVLNDAEALRRCLGALRNCLHSGQNQIIVADGGASAECRAVAIEFCAEYVSSECGRALQMNRGAEIARGEWLWFLHADGVPAAESIAAIWDLDDQTLWGCFRHRIDAPSRWFRVIEAADNLRARVAGLPYGDQGIFVRADVFRSLGGFDSVPLLEDVLLAQRLGELAAPRVLKPILKTDARRWLRKGILSTTLTNWRIMAEFSVLKKSPVELAKLYQK